MIRRWPLAGSSARGVALGGCFLFRDEVAAKHDTGEDHDNAEDMEDEEDEEDEDTDEGEDEDEDEDEYEDEDEDEDSSAGVAGRAHRSYRTSEAAMMLDIVAAAAFGSVADGKAADLTFLPSSCTMGTIGVVRGATDTR